MPDAAGRPDRNIEVQAVVDQVSDPVLIEAFAADLDELQDPGMDRRVIRWIGIRSENEPATVYPVIAEGSRILGG
ncbi:MULTISPECIES: hypothetical protein [Methylobacterium]|uniref:hypothetical protein n=1 Tax=Methylobacterium TaxID=407 RepID=UPI001AEB0CA6|nr:MULTISPECIES: hypothetical protein [Methylobacterium]MBP2493002.1 hypothetical protein [Methylobacterium sp. PvP105]MBP2500625.1 hypothetical protein [Methylobacterium sp. PvP109]MCX7330569.1 hypothetical protein [Hyphomicrobiales bacterium]UIY42617.1 hypothetical protein LZ599_02385 [Methylobacterium radiotolerans]